MQVMDLVNMGANLMGAVGGGNGRYAVKRMFK